MIQYLNTKLGSIRTTNPGCVLILRLSAWRCKRPHADGSGGDTVVNGGGWVVSRGSCVFICYNVCIIESPCAVRRARLQGPTVISSIALLPYSWTVLSWLPTKIDVWSGSYCYLDVTDYSEAFSSCTLAKNSYIHPICMVHHGRVSHHNLSPSSYAPRARTTQSQEFPSDAMRGMTECW